MLTETVDLNQKKYYNKNIFFVTFFVFAWFYI